MIYTDFIESVRLHEDTEADKRLQQRLDAIDEAERQAWAAIGKPLR